MTGQLNTSLITDSAVEEEIECLDSRVTAVESDVAGIAALRAGHRKHNETDENKHCRKQNRHKRYEIEQEGAAEEA